MKENKKNVSIVAGGARRPEWRSVPRIPWQRACFVQYHYYCSCIRSARRLYWIEAAHILLCDLPSRSISCTQKPNAMSLERSAEYKFNGPSYRALSLSLPLLCAGVLLWWLIVVIGAVDRQTSERKLLSTIAATSTILNGYLVAIALDANATFLRRTHFVCGVSIHSNDQCVTCARLIAYFSWVRICSVVVSVSIAADNPQLTSQHHFPFLFLLAKAFLRTRINLSFRFSFDMCTAGLHNSSQCSALIRCATQRIYGHRSHANGEICSSTAAGSIEPMTMAVRARSGHIN